MKNGIRFCRPKLSKFPKVGDIVIKLKCGKTGVISEEEYKHVAKFFKMQSFLSDTSNTSGNIKMTNKEYGGEITVSPEEYDKVKDKFDIVEIVGQKFDPFGQYEYVDFGLASGTLWCTVNVGATSEGALGNYYKYGETTIYDGSDYNTSAYSEVYDPNIDLPSEYDAASTNQGGGWHIPTKAQWDELIDNTTHTYISDYNSTGIPAIKFEKTNDSSTFMILPAGGSYTDGVQKHPEIAYYWTSTTNHYGSVYYPILTEDSYFFTDWSTAFGHGHLVRAVCDSVDSEGLAQKGDVICHNDILNKDVIFSQEDWLRLDDTWTATGFVGINTYSEEDAADGDFIIQSKGQTFIIKSEDYNDVRDGWEYVESFEDTI